MPGPAAEPQAARPGFVVALLVAAIFAVEIGAHELVHVLRPSWPHWLTSILDAVILVAVLLPSLHFLVFMPLVRRLEEREQARQRLLEAQSELERRIAERTAELERANAVITRHAALLFPGIDGARGAAAHCRRGSVQGQERRAGPRRRRGHGGAVTPRRFRERP